MTQTANDLRAILQALSSRSTTLSQNGDPVDAGRVASAMAIVSAALSQLGDEDIVSNLPGANTSDDAKAIRTVIGQMQQAAGDISQQSSDISRTISVATGIANIITDLCAGIDLTTIGTVAKSVLLLL